MYRLRLQRAMCVGIGRDAIASDALETKTIDLHLFFLLGPLHQWFEVT